MHPITANMSCTDPKALSKTNPISSNGVHHRCLARTTTSFHLENPSCLAYVGTLFGRVAMAGISPNPSSSQPSFWKIIGGALLSLCSLERRQRRMLDIKCLDRSHPVYITVACHGLLFHSFNVGRCATVEQPRVSHLHVVSTLVVGALLAPCPGLIRIRLPLCHVGTTAGTTAASPRRLDGFRNPRLQAVDAHESGKGRGRAYDEGSVHLVKAYRQSL